MFAIAFLLAAPAEAGCVPPLPTSPTKAQYATCVSQLTTQLTTAETSLVTTQASLDTANANLAICHTNESSLLANLATCETSLADAAAACVNDTAVKDKLQEFLDAAAAAGVLMTVAP